MYVFPGSGLPANATSDQKNAAMKDYGKKLAAAPSGFLVYHGPGETFSFPKLLGVEFVLEVVESLLAAWLVSLTVLTGLIRRAAFVTGIGIVAAITTNVSYWNWYGFPTNYTAAYVFTQTIGFLCAGLVIAAMTRASAAARRGAAA